MEDVFASIDLDYVLSFWLLFVVVSIFFRLDTYVQEHADGAVTVNQLRERRGKDGDLLTEKVGTCLRVGLGSSSVGGHCCCVLLDVPVVVYCWMYLRRNRVDYIWY
jgi:hypothetical protein